MYLGLDLPTLLSSFFLIEIEDKKRKQGKKNLKTGVVCPKYPASQKPIHSWKGCPIKNKWSWGNGLDVWISYEFNFHMTPKSPKIIHAWWALLTEVSSWSEFFSLQRTYRSQSGMLITVCILIFIPFTKVSHAHPNMNFFFQAFGCHMKVETISYPYISTISPQNHIFVIPQPLQKCIHLFLRTPCTRIWKDVQYRDRGKNKRYVKCVCTPQDFICSSSSPKRISLEKGVII